MASECTIINNVDIAFIYSTETFMYDIILICLIAHHEKLHISHVIYRIDFSCVDFITPKSYHWSIEHKFDLLVLWSRRNSEATYTTQGIKCRLPLPCRCFDFTGKPTDKLTGKRQTAVNGQTVIWGVYRLPIGKPKKNRHNLCI